MLDAGLLCFELALLVADDVFCPPEHAFEVGVVSRLAAFFLHSICNKWIILPWRL